MALNVTLNLNVPELPDNDVAFANNAAWQNYWAAINLVGTLDPVVNAAYVETVFDGTIVGITFNVDGNQVTVPSIEQFNSLLAAYEKLNSAYKQLLTDLKAAGWLANSY